MSEYSAKVIWQHNADEDFLKNKYSRGHNWEFDGGAVIAASAAPSIVPAPWSVAENVDPEEAFVATISSCHMLFFLSFASKQRFVVDQYLDNPVGVLDRNSDGQLAMTSVTLRPQVTFSGDTKPTNEELEKLHQLAHKHCFIANSVKAEVVIDLHSQAG